jgi:hypothetical protein
VGFGSFFVGPTHARQGAIRARRDDQDPRGEGAEVPPGKALKDAVN